MRFNYLLYPAAFEKIKQSGIETRVQELKDSEEGLGFINGNVWDDDIIWRVKRLKEEGFYQHLPKDFRENYKTTLNGMINNPEKFLWTVERPSGTITEPCELGDLLLFTGDLASMVLKADEIWDYSKFGFSSPSELVTTIGAYVIQQSNSCSVREGYKWARKRKDGSEIVTEITGDGHSDLRIFQTEIAPYPTKDPYGNVILMRPDISADKKIVAAYHSTESLLLMSALKYIEQEDLDVNFKKDNAKELIEWGRSLRRGGGSCTEHFGGFDKDPELLFILYDIPIPSLDEKSSTERNSPFNLFMAGGGQYNTFVSEGDLVISYQNEENINNSTRQIRARFLPEDAEHLVKGLIYQSAKGLGRTSVNELLKILEYKFSDSL